MKCIEGIRIGAGRGGFTLIELMMVVGIVIMLAVIAVTAFQQVRLKAHRSSCLNNLRQLEGAKEQYALEHEGAYPMDANALVASGYIERVMDCPANGTYQNVSNTNEVTCSLSAQPEYHDLAIMTLP